jgi:predicted nuclease with TOPRIM domain
MGAPVKHTCPDIDKVIASIKSAMKLANDKRNELEKDDPMDDTLWGIYHELDGLERSLEDLRSDNAALRDWGHKLQDEVDKLEGKVYDLEQEIEEVKLSHVAP